MPGPTHRRRLGRGAAQAAAASPPRARTHPSRPGGRTRTGPDPSPPASTRNGTVRGDD